MKNYYIVIAITETNVSQVFTFIASENQNFAASNDNRVFEIIPNPKSLLFPAYRIELKEELLSKTWIVNSSEIAINPNTEPILETYLQAFTRLNAEIYESAEQYLLAYPSIETDENFI